LVRVEISYVLFLLIVAALMVISLRSLRKHRARTTSDSCPTCSYNLTGNTSGVCPECGTKIAPAA
jgi:uncharacterized paraquat-inducible protein A